MADDWTRELEDLGLTPIRDLASIRAEIADLAKITPLEYEAVYRKASAKQLGLSLATLDREVEAARGRKAAPAAAEEIVETTELWAEPVSGAGLADELRALLRRHVVFSDPADVDAVVLWIFAAWAIGAWRLFPKLLIGSPVKRCGKSTLLELIAALSPRALPTANISAAALFRAIEKWSPTLVIDEADRFLDTNPELVGIINAGHLRSSAFVLRCVETAAGQDVARFNLWCPQVICGIGAVADTIVDRSVRVELRRRLPEERVTRMPRDIGDRMSSVRRRLARWVADAAADLEASETEPPESGNDRRVDNWAPLWRVGEALGGEWRSRALTAYTAAARHDDEDIEPAGVLLVQDVHAIFEARDADFLPTEDVLNGLYAMIERPWSTWSKGRPITANKVGRLARQFGIGSKSCKKPGGRVVREWRREDAREAFLRYATTKTDEKPATPATALNTKGNSERQKRYRDEAFFEPVAGFIKEYQHGSGVAGFSEQGEGEEDAIRPPNEEEDFF